MARFSYWDVPFWVRYFSIIDGLNTVMHVAGSYNEFSLGLAAFCRFGPKKLSFHLSDESLGLDIGLSPCPVTVTITIITFVVGNPYKLSFATVKGEQPKAYIYFKKNTSKISEGFNESSPPMLLLPCHIVDSKRQSFRVFLASKKANGFTRFGAFNFTP